MKNVLVTGSAGFIGGRLIDILTKDDDYFIIGIGRKRRENLMALYKNFRYVPLDILDYDALEKLWRNNNIDIVIHLAALTAHKEIIDNPIETLEINLQGTLNLLDCFSKSSTSKFIYASTGKVYGEIKYLPIDEEHPTNPKNLLGKSKLLTENLIEFFSVISQNSMKEFDIVRIFNVYGPKQRNYFLIPTILNQIKNKRKYLTLGNITDRRDYIFIDDLINFLCTLIRRDISIGLNYFNLGSGRSYSAEEIIEVVKKILKLNIKIKVDSSRMRKDESPEERAKISKVKAIDWKPKYSLEKGLIKTIKYYLKSEV